LEDVNNSVVVMQIIEDAVASGSVAEMLSDDFVENSTVGESAMLEAIEAEDPTPQATETTTAAPTEGKSSGESEEKTEETSPLLIGAILVGLVGVITVAGVTLYKLTKSQKKSATTKITPAGSFDDLLDDNFFHHGNNV
jgi:hypothetical protein